MRGQEFLDKMELIEPAYVEAADIMPKKKKSIWIKCGAAAACCHAEIRRRLNPVGKNRIRRAVQTAYAANLKA